MRERGKKFRPKEGLAVLEYFATLWYTMADNQTPE